MHLMASILIKDTTREQREQTVRESLGDDYDVGCGYESTGINYQLYIDGVKELRLQTCNNSNSFIYLSIISSASDFMSSRSFSASSASYPSTVSLLFFYLLSHFYFTFTLDYTLVLLLSIFLQGRWSF